MNSEREIVKKLYESKQVDFEDQSDLNEAEFEFNGNSYFHAFGKYMKDGKPISKDEYLAASDAYNKSGAVKDPEPKGPSDRKFRASPPSINEASEVKLRHIIDTWNMIDKYGIKSWTDHNSYITISADDYNKMLNSAKNQAYIKNLRL